MASPIAQVSIVGRAAFDTSQAKQGIDDPRGQAGGVKSAVAQVNAEMAAAQQTGQSLGQDAESVVSAAQQGWEKLGHSFKPLPQEVQNSLAQVRQAVQSLDLGRLIDLETQLKLPPNLTGKYKTKFKAAQGGWGVGSTDNITESSLELLVALFAG